MFLNNYIWADYFGRANVGRDTRFGKSDQSGCRRDWGAGGGLCEGLDGIV